MVNLLLAVCLSAQLEQVGLELPIATEDESGVHITTVLPGTPASRAGLRDGDVIVEVDGKRVESACELEKAIHEARTRFEVVVERGGERKTFTPDRSPPFDLRLWMAWRSAEVERVRFVSGWSARREQEIRGRNTPRR